MKALGRYDTELQMFVDEDHHDVDERHLAFMRWLRDNGRLTDDTQVDERSNASA